MRRAILKIGIIVPLVAVPVGLLVATCDPGSSSPATPVPPPGATRWVQPGNEDVCVLVDGRWIEEDDREDCTPDEPEIDVKAPAGRRGVVRTTPRAVIRPMPNNKPIGKAKP